MKFRRIIALIALLMTCALLLGGCVVAHRQDSSTVSSTEDAQTVRSDDSLIWWQKTIAYEIYVKSFKDSDGDGIGDLNGITSELDHLKSLGVGAVWLTPCYVSPQADNGYDIADYYNIDPTYGTMEDMETLIAEAGKRDIRIVMDLVFNHTSNENEWFTESRSSADNEKSDWYIWADPKEDGSPPPTGAAFSAALPGSLTRPEASTTSIPSFLSSQTSIGKIQRSDRR